jgi:hypothetical protein
MHLANRDVCPSPVEATRFVRRIIFDRLGKHGDRLIVFLFPDENITQATQAFLSAVLNCLTVVELGGRVVFVVPGDCRPLGRDHPLQASHLLFR